MLPRTEAVIFKLCLGGAVPQGSKEIKFGATCGRKFPNGGAGDTCLPRHCDVKSVLRKLRV